MFTGRMIRARVKVGTDFCREVECQRPFLKLALSHCNPALEGFLLGRHCHLRLSVSFSEASSDVLLAVGCVPIITDVCPFSSRAGLEDLSAAGLDSSRASTACVEEISSILSSAVGGFGPSSPSTKSQRRSDPTHTRTSHALQTREGTDWDR